MQKNTKLKRIVLLLVFMISAAWCGASVIHSIDGYSAIQVKEGNVQHTPKPAPSSNSNLITLDITNQPVGTTYSLKWYNSETGLPFHMAVMDVTVQQDLQGKKFLSFQFPSHIRNLGKHTINNTLGDAVFVLIRSNQVPSQKK